MITRHLPFLANSAAVTRFAIIDCKLDPAPKLAVLKLALDWVLNEQAAGEAMALATPWRATFYKRDKAGHRAIVAVVEVTAADATEERIAAGHQFRFHVEVEFGLPLDGALPAFEATVQRIEAVSRSPSDDMIGYTDTPDLDPDGGTFAPKVASWLQDWSIAADAVPDSAFPDSLDALLKSSTPQQGAEESRSLRAPRSERALPIVRASKTLEAAEPVDAAVFCPQTVGRATSFLVQVFLYPPDLAEAAREQAREADAGAARRGVLSLLSDVPISTRIDLRLEIPGLLVDEPDVAHIWRGTLAAAQFGVAVPADATLGTAVGRIRFSIAGVPCGTLRFQVTVAAVATSAAAHAAEIGVRRYRRAFVSYSSKDRAEVLRRVQAFRIAGLSVFQDVLDLEPGDRWERELYREIDNCDVVLLFWSRAAAASPWVAKEIDYALARKQGQEDRPPEIAPVPIEGPPIPAPPDKLRHLHFNDALLAHIAAAQATQ